MKELKEFTVERLEEIIEWTEVFGRHPKLDECTSLAKIALAAKQAEPVGYFRKMPNDSYYQLSKSTAVMDEIPLYTTPPLNHAEQHMVVPDGWIKCSEHMPEDGQIVVIINAGHGEIYEAATVTRHGPHFLLLDGLEASNYDGGAVVTLSLEATHWMPLPAAPKPEM